MADVPLHTEVGLVESAFECEYCGDVIDVPRFKNVETQVGQHVTYHCPVVGLVPREA